MRGWKAIRVSISMSTSNPLFTVVADQIAFLRLVAPSRGKAIS